MDMLVIPAVAPAHRPLSQTLFWPKPSHGTQPSAAASVAREATNSVPTDGKLGVLLDLYV